VSADKPEGTGPGGRITPEDIRAKAGALAGGVEGSVQSAKPLLMYAAVGGALLVVVVSYWLGRRGGRRRSTIVEIRRG
jgi:membrane protein DedA with SNARE-associated domain